jgi:hypothetical protein
LVLVEELLNCRSDLLNFFALSLHLFLQIENSTVRLHNDRLHIGKQIVKTLRVGGKSSVKRLETGGLCLSRLLRSVQGKPPEQFFIGLNFPPEEIPHRNDKQGHPIGGACSDEFGEGRIVGAKFACHPVDQFPLSGEAVGLIAETGEVSGIATQSGHVRSLFPAHDACFAGRTEFFQTLATVGRWQRCRVEEHPYLIPERPVLATGQSRLATVPE